MLNKSEVEALKTALTNDNGWIGWSTIVVFVGLIVEYGVLLWFKKKEMSSLEIVIAIACGLAIAGGVYGELFFRL